MKNLSYNFKTRVFICTLLAAFAFTQADMQLHAQVAAKYYFTTSNTAPYVPITGGHVVGGSNDDDSYYLDSIGFSFKYDDTLYTTLYIDANGYVVLGNTAPYGSYFMGHPLGFNSHCIAGFTNDLQGQGSTSSAMRIQTIGTAPNRTCVVQYSDWSLYPAPDTTTANDHYNFQIRLNENNGLGTVQVVYGRMQLGSTLVAPFGTISGSMGAQAGLTGGSILDFNNRMSRTPPATWDSTIAGTFNSSSVTAYNTLAPDSGRTFTWTHACTIAYDSINTSEQTICSGPTTLTINGSLPTTSATSYSYLWQTSSTASGGYSSASGTNNTQDYMPFFISSNTWFRRVVMFNSFCSDTSAPVLITTTDANTWTGATSNAWGNASNWFCGHVPTSSDSVVITNGVPNNPVIIDGGRLAYNLTILPSATLTLNNSSSLLNIFGTLTVNGTLANTNGTIVFSGAASQPVPGITYNNLTISNAAGARLTGNATINGTLNLAAGNLTLDTNNLTLAGTTSAITGATASKYIVTNSTGTLRIQNIGATARTSAVSFPVGSSTANYNPVTITNTGTADEFRIRVMNGVSYTYTGSTPGPLATGVAVNKTWFINEAVVGGSTATVALQWNASDELTGFTRASSNVSIYNGTIWTPSTSAPATGTNPYTQSLNGVTNFYGQFGVGSNGALPVKILSFDGKSSGQFVHLNWVTTNEENNKYFILERSINGTDFTSIDKIKGSNNSESLQEYNYADLITETMLKNTIVYYRLKQEDNDGTIAECAQMIAVKLDETINPVAVSVEPNPFSDKLSVALNSSNSGIAQITIKDITGRIIHEEQLEILKGTNTFEISNAGNLTKGMYVMTIQTNEGQVSQKMVKGE